jgi:tetratricopeptide (TPR) repeat protein
MKQFLCELLFTCALLGPGAPPVDELTYGTVLYEYFQDDYQAALLQVLVAEAQQRRGENTTRFDLAEGSFAFADGMYGYAGETFAGVAQEEIAEIDQMRLAFHLAREFHRRQDWDNLSTQLDKIELGKSWFGRERLHPEVEYMRAELAVSSGHFETAEQRFAQMDESDPLRAYGLFNLGVAYREAEQLPQAMAMFAQLAELPAYSEEAYDLSQRARLAMALIARQEQQTQSAETVLSALPGDGRYQEVAMAAYGGLAMDNEDYELAARIWMTLQEQEYWTPSTATARLGFPLSLERMAAQQGGATTEMALLQFQRAEASFSNRLANLQQLSQEAQDPAWIHDLLRVFSPNERDPEQMQVLMENWQQRLGHTDWLEWLATDNVNQVLTQWRELNGMESWLNQLPQSLSALQGVAAEQQRRTEQAEVLLHDNGLVAKRALLQERVAQSVAQLSELSAAQPAKEAQWMLPLATAEERKLLSQLSQMRSLVVHMNAQDQLKWSARIKRLEGVVFYRLVDERAKRLQLLRKQHQELSDLLADVDARITRVEGAESEFIAGVGTNFLVFQDRANDITDQVKAARIGRETLLANEIRGRMQQEIQQVQQYLLVTRIAIARATDQLAIVGDGAATPVNTGDGGAR